MLVGCQFNQSKPDKPSKAKLKATILEKRIEVENPEVLDFDSVLLNNKIPFQTTVQKLKYHFGKPDSIIVKNYDCGGYFEEGDVSIYYYGLTSFETKGDTAAIQNIDLGTGRFRLKFKNIFLDRNTSLSDLKKIFPISISKSYMLREASKNKDYQFVRIYPRTNYDDEWVLTFYNGKLIEIDYWIDC